MLMSEAVTSCDLSYRLMGCLRVSPASRQPHTDLFGSENWIRESYAFLLCPISNGCESVNCPSTLLSLTDAGP